MKTASFFLAVALFGLTCMRSSASTVDTSRMGHGAEPAATLSGKILTVNSTGDAVDAHPGDGKCKTGAGVCTLRAAIQESNALGGSNTIKLPAGHFVLSIPGGGPDDASTGDLDITSNLTILGVGATKTIIDGNGGVTADRVFDIAGNVTVTIGGVTIEGGNAGSLNSGGGIFIATSARLNLKQSMVTGNTARAAGGIYDDGTLVLSFVTVMNNKASIASGGGIAIDSGARATITMSTVINNTANGVGGGIGNSGTLLANRSTVSLNTSVGAGGGIFTDGIVTLRNSTVASNLASNDWGGGIYNDFGNVSGTGILTIVDSTIVGNQARFNGGGIANSFHGVTNLFNVTIAGNNAESTGGGGGIFNDPGWTGDIVNLMNTLIADNTDGVLPITSPDDCKGGLSSGGHNLIENVSVCTLVGGVGDQTGVNPHLGPLQNNGGPTKTKALLTSSPAIDAGNPKGCKDNTGRILTTDQRGDRRPADGDHDGDLRCDIGAYEAQ